ncbi:hypothetical protein [Ktedonobacter robiniae]|uniref:Heparan-alpha-glucosaminide N-acetyltransferase catalytic domain-containing protein n=1 Tax=Ktedonobacter robiniae TaxID=2778365 RepID=A0ABQ3UHB8_9CHLR|nr:hypothetical protein [Ktedonobacter robiniae]GHO51980.1 hypothetical protein KSB_04550 [Ktedonobacter robiniae]
MSTAIRSGTAVKNLTRDIQKMLPRERSTLAHLEDIVPQNIVKEGLVLRKHVREGRFQRSLAVITVISGLFTGLEVGYEHYRGSYGQRIMYTPIILSFALIFAGAWAVFNRWAARTVLRVISLLSIVDGVLGFYYHIRGVARKPGGWRIPIFNVIMGPPVFAPLLFSTVGFLGLVTSFLRREDAPTVAGPVLPGKITKQSRLSHVNPKFFLIEELLFAQDVREGRFQRILGVVAALSALFSWIESLYSHYKNNFSYRIQWSPILVGPPLVIAGIASVWSRTVARTLLPLTSLLALLNGAIGFFYHLRGVVRRPGGLKKPFYNVLYGPPIFAPLLFSASGFIGLLASLLRRARR